MKKTDKYNRHYHEKGRNGWTPSTTIDDVADMVWATATGDPKSSFEIELLKVTTEITELLILKNKAYGNTALNPTNIFSKLSATEAICARLDDKIARIKNKGINDKTEDTVDDLIGYLLLLKMSMNEEK